MYKKSIFDISKRVSLFLKLEIIKKTYGIIVLALAVVFFNSPIAIALTGVVTAFISTIINASPNKKLMGYSYFEQMKDILPSFLSALIMCAIVMMVGRLKLNSIIVLLLQIIIGILVYILISVVFRLKPFMTILDMIRNKSRNA